RRACPSATAAVQLHREALHEVAVVCELGECAGASAGGVAVFGDADGRHEHARRDRGEEAAAGLVEEREPGCAAAERERGQREATGRQARFELRDPIAPRAEGAEHRVEGRGMERGVRRVAAQRLVQAQLLRYLAELARSHELEVTVAPA